MKTVALLIVKLGILSAAFAVMTGCASIMNGTQQSIKVETLAQTGERIDGADCQLSNGDGTVLANSGQHALVSRSGSTLRMKCSMAGQSPAVGQAVSRINGGMIGNVLFGGLIGIAIDGSNGAGFSYPEWIQLVFGQERIFDRRVAYKSGPSAGELVTTTAVDPQRSAENPAAVKQAGSSAAATRSIAPLGKGDVLQYLLTDKASGREARVNYRLDDIKGDELVFNEGERIETANGRVVLVRNASGGLFDSLMPEGGWAPANVRPGMSWSTDSASLKVRARADGESMMVIDGENVRVVAVRIEGWHSNTQSTTGGPRLSPIDVRFLYAPEMKRVVQMDAEAQGPSGRVQESFKLQHVKRNS